MTLSTKVAAGRNRSSIPIPTLGSTRSSALPRRSPGMQRVSALSAYEISKKRLRCLCDFGAHVPGYLPRDLCTSRPMNLLVQLQPARPTRARLG
jgi:hypothetical protein